MNRLLRVLLAAAVLCAALPSPARPAPAALDVHWNEGAQDCATSAPPPIQVLRYDAQTYILRESLCATFEAPFLYLLIGSGQALLVDTGAVSDPQQMPLAQTVMALLTDDKGARMPLIVAHTHGHHDHRAGDAQFEDLPNVQLVPSDLASVRSYFGFADWPNGRAQIDLGERIIDVIPVPGHHPAHVAFYDRRTGLLLSGDFLLPGRLLVDDAAAYAASARRLAEFIKDRPVSHVLGAHIELAADGHLFDWGSQYHPNERALEMTPADVLALPAAMRQFNGFYTRSGGFVMVNSLHILIALGVAGLLVLAAIGAWLRRFLRRRKRAARAAA